MKDFEQVEKEALKGFSKEFAEISDLRDAVGKRVEKYIRKLERKYKPVTIQDRKELGRLIPDCVEKVFYFHKVILMEKGAGEAHE